MTMIILSKTTAVRLKQIRHIILYTANLTKLLILGEMTLRFSPRVAPLARRC